MPPKPITDNVAPVLPSSRYCIALPSRRHVNVPEPALRAQFYAQIDASEADCRPDSSSPQPPSERVRYHRGTPAPGGHSRSAQTSGGATMSIAEKSTRLTPAEIQERV